MWSRSPTMELVGIAATPPGTIATLTAEGGVAVVDRETVASLVECGKGEEKEANVARTILSLLLDTHLANHNL